MLDDDAAALNVELRRITETSPTALERVRRLVHQLLEHDENPARIQVHVHLWTEFLTDYEVRPRLAGATDQRREAVTSWIQAGVGCGELKAIPEADLTSILLALSDGLMLHGALDPDARWNCDIRGGIDLLLSGIEADELA